MKYKFLIFFLLIIIIVGCNSNNSEYKEIMELGQDAMINQKFDEAVTKYTEALEEKPNDKQAMEMLLLAKTELEKQKTALAKSQIEEPKASDKLRPSEVIPKDEPTLNITKKENKFYINDITLSMNIDDAINLLGEPDTHIPQSSSVPPAMVWELEDKLELSIYYYTNRKIDSIDLFPLDKQSMNSVLGNLGTVTEQYGQNIYYKTIGQVLKFSDDDENGTFVAMLLPPMSDDPYYEQPDPEAELVNQFMNEMNSIAPNYLRLSPFTKDNSNPGMYHSTFSEDIRFSVFINHDMITILSITQKSDSLSKAFQTMMESMIAYMDTSISLDEVLDELNDNRKMTSPTFELGITNIGHNSYHLAWNQEEDMHLFMIGNNNPPINKYIEIIK